MIRVPAKVWLRNGTAGFSPLIIQIERIGIYTRRVLSARLMRQIHQAIFSITTGRFISDTTFSLGKKGEFVSHR
jgi:hypothetical protein